MIQQSLTKLALNEIVYIFIHCVDLELTPEIDCVVLHILKHHEIYRPSVASPQRLLRYFSASVRHTISFPKTPKTVYSHEFADT